MADYFWLPPKASFKVTADPVIPLIAFGIFCGVAILMVVVFRALVEAHIEGEQRATSLSHEMRHRSDNLLGMVQASMQTARKAATVSDYQKQFTAKFTALSQGAPPCACSR
jgi:K+-sensing histidine kinase KdpD